MDSLQLALKFRKQQNHTERKRKKKNILIMHPSNLKKKDINIYENMKEKYEIQDHFIF